MDFFLLNGHTLVNGYTYIVLPSLNFAENFPPSMSGDPILRVTVGEPSTYQLRVEDEGDELDVSVEGGLPDGATLTDNGGGDYSFRWTPAEAIEYPLTFVAVDGEGASAKLKPQVQVCGCVNGGECTLDGIFNLVMASSVVMNCDCPEGLFPFCQIGDSTHAF